MGISGGAGATQTHLGSSSSVVAGFPSSFLAAGVLGQQVFPAGRGAEHLVEHPVLDVVMEAQDAFGRQIHQLLTVRAEPVGEGVEVHEEFVVEGDIDPGRPRRGTQVMCRRNIGVGV
ncbi:hypothetical protein [Rhodococcus koreensis]